MRGEFRQFCGEKISKVNGAHRPSDGKALKTGQNSVKKLWHGGCIQVFNGEANTEWRSRKTRNGDKKMNGLIKQTKLDGLNQLGSFAIAFFSVIAVVYVFVGGSV
jgi:hypothetical protein